MGSTEIAGSSAVASSNASARPSSTVSVSQLDVEIRPSLLSDGERASNSKSRFSPLIRIFSICFLLFFCVGVVGTCSYYYYYHQQSSNTEFTKASSSLKPSSIRSGSKSSLKTAASHLSEPVAEQAGPFKRVQLALTKHPRSFAVVVSAVILAVALIATVVMLVRALNAPPQVIEKDAPTHADGPVSSGSVGGTMTTGGIIGIVLSVVFFSAFIGVLVYYKKFKKPKTVEIQVPGPIVVQRVQGFSDEMAIMARGNPEEIKASIRALFDGIAAIVQPAEDTWDSVNNVPDDTPPNMRFMTASSYWWSTRKSGRTGHMQLVEDWAPWQYYRKMLQHRDTLPDAIGGHRFSLLVSRSSYAIREYDKICDDDIADDLIFTVVLLDNIDSDSPYLLREMYKRLLTYEACISMPR